MVRLGLLIGMIRDGWLGKVDRYVGMVKERKTGLNGTFRILGVGVDWGFIAVWGAVCGLCVLPRGGVWRYSSERLEMR